MRDYRFESKNAGTVCITVTGEYRDHWAKDIDACYFGSDGVDGNDREFEECDDADEIMQWLVNEGVEFESDRTMAFNRAYIQSVLIDGDATEDELLGEMASWTDEDIARKLQLIDR